MNTQTYKLENGKMVKWCKRASVQACKSGKIYDVRGGAREFYTLIIFEYLISRVYDETSKFLRLSFHFFYYYRYLYSLFNITFI